MRERLSPILEPYRGHKESLIPVLQKVQGEVGYLPEEAVSEIAVPNVRTRGPAFLTVVGDTGAAFTAGSVGMYGDIRVA